MVLDKKSVDSYASNMPRWLVSVLNEKAKRFWIEATEMELGDDGVAAVSKSTGLAPNTVRTGIRDTQDPQLQASQRIRRPGAGHKAIVQHNQTLVRA